MRDNAIQNDVKSVEDIEIEVKGLSFNKCYSLLWRTANQYFFGKISCVEAQSYLKAIISHAPFSHNTTNPTQSQKNEIKILQDRCARLIKFM